MKKILYLILLGSIVMVTGCFSNKVSEKPIYISADRHQYMMTNEVGVVGWFVPLAVHSEMMEALIYMEQSKDAGGTNNKD